MSLIEEASANAVLELKRIGATEIIPLSDGMIFLAKGVWQEHHFCGVYHILPEDMRLDQLLIQSMDGVADYSLVKWGMSQMGYIRRLREENISELESLLHKKRTLLGWIENAMKDMKWMEIP